ncbi:MAG: Crp/Fnr family transcriptional regulator [Erysipelotrichaceae bacterium]|nr:Crp/Fnr family transcriptional regulator [Erysipelotrichaceae bacterium]
MRVSAEEKDFRYFEEVGTIMKYQSGEYIFTRGDLADTIYVIKSGRALVSVTTESGREFSFEVLKKGHIFGDGSFVEHYRREVDISAVTDMELIVCKTERLLPVLAEHPDLMLLMFQHITVVTNELSHQLVRMMQYDSMQKVADYILSCTKTSNSMPYTHSDIAAGLGLNRVTVSNVMKDLRNKGLIDYSYGVVTVRNRDGLMELLPL